MIHVRLDYPTVSSPSIPHSNAPTTRTAVTMGRFALHAMSSVFPSQAPQASQSDVLHRSLLLLALTAALMAALLAFLPAAGHDQLWFLLMGRRWLQGATLYGPEIFDSNPPLVIWLSAIPVRISELSHSDATLPAKCLVLGIGLLVAWLSDCMLKRVWRNPRPERPALLFAFIVLFFVAPARDLGQRDSLTVLLALPYVLCAARQSESAIALPFRVAGALLASVAFCLKPQDALIGVAVEFTCLLRATYPSRNVFSALNRCLRRPELPILLVSGLLYLLAIRLWAPLYFTEALPVLRSTYWAIGGLSLPALFGQAIELTLLALATLVALWLIRPAAATMSLFAAGFGALVAYLVQGTGWYYQQLPAIGLFGAALTLQLLDLHKKHPVQPPRWTLPTLAATCLLAVGLTTHFMGYPFTRTRAFALTSPDPAFFAGLPPGTPVAILTTSVDEAMMPVEQFHLTWAQRTDNLWLLPALLRSQSPTPNKNSGQAPPSRLTPDAVAALDTLQHCWMAEDLTRWRPKLVLVERCHDPTITCQVLEGRHDNLLAWFQRDPAFTQLWTHYRHTAAHDRFDAYVYQP